MGMLISPAKAGAAVGVCGRTVKRWILDGRLEGHWLKTPTGRYKVDLDAVLLLVSGNRALSFEPPLIVKTN